MAVQIQKNLLYGKFVTMRGERIRKSRFSLRDVIYEQPLTANQRFFLFSFTASEISSRTFLNKIEIAVG